ncbi:hypothetical protein G7K_5028-t1 [Saitoella complicata NRRL Y-17804]|uniref:Uncharacterized protein n=1 Tax=Saitoella complicata (strain BCRC 22490 / CBS 7301 / JCM 7358 / NBRC 10748 / NRRL Y-17804) TaxID=698492 RepID=A0A0E9NM49_SAICN|nr:hypothetical protein G7K_5028-t1 [Saitoella complicata NRRL Y-17804]
MSKEHKITLRQIGMSMYFYYTVIIEARIRAKANKTPLRNSGKFPSVIYRILSSSYPHTPRFISIRCLLGGVGTGLLAGSLLVRVGLETLKAGLGLLSSGLLFGLAGGGGLGTLLRVLLLGRGGLTARHDSDLLLA